MISLTLLDALVAYCVTKGLITGDGIDTFRDFMPDKPDTVVAFIEYGGSPVSPLIDAVHRSVQVSVRSKSSTEARAKAVQLCRAFTSTTEDYRINFTTELWGQVYIKQTPFKFYQDEYDRTVYGFNLGITTNIID